MIEIEGARRGSRTSISDGFMMQPFGAGRESTTAFRNLVDRSRYRSRALWSIALVLANARSWEFRSCRIRTGAHDDLIGDDASAGRNSPHTPPCAADAPEKAAAVGEGRKRDAIKARREK